jgi:hypothetical protein
MYTRALLLDENTFCVGFAPARFEKRYSPRVLTFVCIVLLAARLFVRLRLPFRLASLYTGGIAAADLSSGRAVLFSKFTAVGARRLYRCASVGRSVSMGVAFSGGDRSGSGGDGSGSGASRDVATATARGAPAPAARRLAASSG